VLGSAPGALGAGARRTGSAMQQAALLEIEAMPVMAATPAERPAATSPMVGHFRQTFLWPIYLLPIKADSQVQDHCAYLLHSVAGSPWQEVVDEFTGEPDQFQEPLQRVRDLSAAGAALPLWPGPGQGGGQGLWRKLDPGAASLRHCLGSRHADGRRGAGHFQNCPR